MLPSLVVVKITCGDGIERDALLKRRSAAVLLSINRRLQRPSQNIWSIITIATLRRAAAKLSV